MAERTTSRKSTETSLGILLSVAILYALAMQFAHEQVEHAWTRIRASYDLQCWSVSSMGDGLSRYELKGCGRSATYACSPLQVITPLFPLTYGISCARSE